MMLVYKIVMVSIFAVSIADGVWTTTQLRKFDSRAAKIRMVNVAVNAALLVWTWRLAC